MVRRVLVAAIVCITMGVSPMTAHSDEGMWLLNVPPTKVLKERHQYELTEAFLDKAMKSSVRFNNGGSGGFVSPDGLIVTNHHIAADALQKLSTKDKDLFKLGFYAKERSDEAACPDLELNVLQSIEDVTANVNASVKPDMKPGEAAAARRAVMGELESASLKATGLRSDVVTLYNGGAYHLYRYKKYTDVRLVFAPEQAIAAFGGDVDNFEYPRHGLDFSFFRVYENGKPAVIKDYFKWSTVGPKENDLVFVTGHPGVTQRLETLAKLKHRRDVTLPYTLTRLRMMEAALTQFGDRGPEEHRRANASLHSAANARKAFSGQLQGLLDPKIIEQKLKQETELQLVADPPRRPVEPDALASWTKIENAQKSLKTFEREYYLLERGDAFSSELFTIARQCVRLPAELEKKSSDRLREYRDSNLESLKFQLFSNAPIYADLERAKLQAGLTFLAENLGGEHPLVVKILAGKNPAQRAEELVAGCMLFKPEERKKLTEKKDASAESKDPIVKLAISIDQEARALRKRYEDEVEEVERQAYSEIAKIRFKLYGTSVAPDATFTLRLAFGLVKGYEVEGKQLPFQTTFGSAFERSKEMQNRDPYELPASWVKAKDQLDMKTPFNIAATSDTIGGNSGSPVLNRNGELVGINFDRNRHGLVRNFVYTEVQARHISVSGLAVLESLRKVYNAGKLAEELVAK